MTSIAEFNRNPCPQIDATDVNAYFDLSLSEEDPTKLIFDNSWGTQTLDLTPAIKAGETVTHLMLDPTENPVYLRFDNEAGDSECIHGDGLSRIISMRYLKDVAQGEQLSAGDVYMLGDDGEFHVHNLAEFETTTDDRLTNLENRVATLELTVNQLVQDVNQIKQILTRPDGIPANTRLVWGNIDLFSDYTNSDNRNWGLFTHNINNLIPNDEFFA